MIRPPARLAAAVLTACSLAACGSIAGQSPHEMLRTAMQNNLTQDNRYNFQSEGRIFLSAPDQGTLADWQAAEAAAQTAAVLPPPAEAHRAADGQTAPKTDSNKTGTPSASSADTAFSCVEKIMNGNTCAETDNQAANAPAEKGSWGKEAVEHLQAHPVLAQYLQNLRIKAEGAVDLQQEKGEVHLELSGDNRNEQFKLRGSFLMDAKDLSIRADLPAGLLLYLGYRVSPEMQQRLLNEPLRFSAEGKWQKLPLRTVLRALIAAGNLSVTDLPPQNYRLLPLDAFGRQNGAAYRINLPQTPENVQRQDKAMRQRFDEIYDRLRREQPEAGISSEAYDTAKRQAQTTLSLFTMFPSDADPLHKLSDKPLMYDFYLGRHGRLVGYRFYGQVNGSRQALNFDLSTRLFDFGSPRFTFRDSARSIGWQELLRQKTGKADSRK